MALGLLAMVAGWSLRAISVAQDWAEPLVPVWGVLVPWLLAAGVGLQVVLTRSALRSRPPRLSAAQAVNRLLLGQAAMLSGAVILGAYAGTVISHLGAITTELTDERYWRGGLAALAGLALLVAGLLLERACRVPPDPS